MEVPADAPKNAGVAFRLNRQSVDYIENRITELFSVPHGSVNGVFFDPEVDRYVEQAANLLVNGTQAESSANTILITADMQDQRASFVRAVGEYQAKLKNKSKSKLNFDVQRSTWSELLEDVDKFHERYQLKEKTGIQDYIRDAARGIGKWESSVTAWLGLLPAGALETAVLVGGLKLIFGTARRLDVTREDTKNILEQIPYTIHKAHSLTKSYHDSQRLQVFASQVYVAVMEALEHILGYYKENAIAKFFKTVVLADQYKPAMKTSFSNLQKLEKRLDEQGMLDLHGRDAEICQIGKENLRIGRQNFQSGILHANFLNEMLQLLDDKVSTLKDQIMLQQNEKRKQQQAVKKLHNELQAKKQHSAYRLCESLGYEDGIIYGDIERVIYNGLSTGDKDRNRVVYLLEQAEEVREWLQPGQSQVLIINGMGEACDAISSTSVFCAMMSHGIGNADDVMVLRWFCGLHITDEGVPAMLRNLIGQVLMHVNTAVDLSKHKTIWFKKYWNCEDPRMLLDLLEDFIREQLEKTPVLILLDGASFLENKTYFRDMYCTVQRLSSLVDGKDGCEFKLLLTSPIRVMELLSRSDPAIVLNVPHWVDGVTFAANQNDLLEIAQSQARGLGDAFDDLEIR